jgi:hypothetical protein
LPTKLLKKLGSLNFLNKIVVNLKLMKKDKISKLNCYKSLNLRNDYKENKLMDAV